MNAMANATMSIDKKYKVARSQLPPKAAKLVTPTSVQVIQNRRSDSLDPRVHQKHKITGGNFLQSSRYGQVEIAQTRILPAKELLAKVHIRPLRRFPREGDKTIPVLVTFDSAPQCADAERTLRANKVSVAPNYLSEVFRLVKKIRCIQTKYPDRNILIRPSSHILISTLKLELKVENGNFSPPSPCL